MQTLEQTLADLIRINSVNSFYPGGPGESELANYVESYFARLGIRTWRQAVLPSRDNVIACIPGKRPDRRVILEAHMDTVSVEGMAIPPFEPRVEGRKMYGRGACDTKAGLAGMMHAVASLQRSGKSPPCEIWLAAVVDEEFSFRGALKLCEGLKADAAIVAEPTELRPVIATKGVLRWRMVSKGIAAHSSKTHLGVNAINHMARVVLALERDHLRLAEKRHPLLGPGTCNVGLISGGQQVNFVPDCCSIEIDRRLLPNELVHEVLKHYQTLLDSIRQEDPSFDVRMEEPMLVDQGLDTPSSAKVAQIASEILSDMGLDGQFAGVPYGSDASKLSNCGVPSIVFGAGNIDQAHAAIEFVDLDQVAQAEEFFSRFITTFD